MTQTGGTFFFRAAVDGDDAALFAIFSLVKIGYAIATFNDTWMYLLMAHSFDYIGKLIRKVGVNHGVTKNRRLINAHYLIFGVKLLLTFNVWVLFLLRDNRKDAGLAVVDKYIYCMFIAGDYLWLAQCGLMMYVFVMLSQPVSSENSKRFLKPYGLMGLRVLCGLPAE